VVTVKSKKPGFKASIEESAILAIIACDKKASVATSDLRNRANQARTGNGALSSTDQVQYDKISARNGALSSTDQAQCYKIRALDKKGDTAESDYICLSTQYFH